MGSDKSRSGSGNYIGEPLPRWDTKRLLAGRGRYVDDLRVPRLLHAAMLRSPHAHARIVGIDTQRARGVAGVVRVLTGRDVAELCQPYVGVLTHIPGMRSAPQYPLALDHACWQGEPVAIVVAENRALAEDGAQAIDVEWQALPPVTDPETALDPGTPAIHETLGSNLCFERTVDTGGVDEAFAGADRVVEAEFRTARHTIVTLEPRSMLADYNPADGSLTVWHSTQVPYMMQWIIARHFGLAESSVRVIAPDVGGSFGLKIHTYGDEMATIAASIATGCPVKHVADRLDSFQSDVHARGHRVRCRMALSAAGDILGVDVDDRFGVGPYSGYPRGSVNEGIQVSNLVCAAYQRGRYRAVSRAVFQNKPMYGQYRAVGHPVACLASEGLVDLAARALGMDPAVFRRRNYLPANGYPHAISGGMTFEALSQHEALEKLLALMNYDKLRAEQAALRERGIWRGIGLASVVESSNPSSATYGQGGASIAAQDACTVKLLATGAIQVAASLTETGQGTNAVLAQIAATAVGVPVGRVKVVTGDTDATPYGGGNFGSRGTGIGGEAALQAGRALRANILAFVARLVESEASLLDVRDGNVVDAATGAVRISLEEVARTAYFRTHEVPRDFQPELTVTRSYAQKSYPAIFTNCIQASWLEVDADTGLVRLIRHWIVDDCGTVVNPLLVDEQLRGACVQGLGAALYEQCLFSREGQLLNGNLADYLVPMAGEMPDIVIGHTATPTKSSQLGAKGAGEAGTAGASAAVLNAVNDALAPLGARVAELPITPERVLLALGRA